MSKIQPLVDEFQEKSLNHDKIQKARTGEIWEDPLCPQEGWQRCSRSGIGHLAR